MAIGIFKIIRTSSAKTKSYQERVQCRVLYCHDEDMFVNICKRLSVTNFPNGLTPNNTIWNKVINTKRNNISGHEAELENTGMCEGKFEGIKATILHIKVEDKRDVTCQIITILWFKG